jgi:hypothetical protein
MQMKADHLSDSHHQLISLVPYLQPPHKALCLQGNMKQHQMTHKFRDSSSDPGQTSPHTAAKSAESSPIHSPPLSPAPRAAGGVKRPQEVAAMVDRPAEKRAILCG